MFRIEPVASADATVLLNGETGTARTPRGSGSRWADMKQEWNVVHPFQRP